uniref:LysM domain receptor-like kinase 4 n=1 Tax=Quercus lobata TaxID=97700 RepID=A0A7N2KN60_QUELO
MIYLCFVIWICINSCFAQQYYDPSDCSSEPRNGSRYECQYSFQNSCTTFLVYRANRHFQTISSISDLFILNSTEVLQQNSVTSSDEILKPGREVLVPINCFCSDRFFQANVSYKVLSNLTFSEIACGVLEGLLNSPILSGANPSQGKEPEFGSELQVPLRCGCPDNFTTSKRVIYLVTYPFIEGDETGTLSIKPTVFPNTTVLIPLTKVPVMDFSVPDPPPPTPAFLPTISNRKKPKSTKSRNLYMAISIAGAILVLVALVACGIMALKKLKGEKFMSRSSLISCSRVRSSPRSANSCLSPDILVEVKYSLFMYSIEDLKKATRDFSEENKIGGEIVSEDGLHQSTFIMAQLLSSEKVDIFAFGVILLELISAWEDLDGKSFKGSITFLGGASEGGCFEQLRSFMDPSLKDDNPLAEALCLAVLAKACLEDDPLHRPTMDDIMKVLARMV